MMLSCRSCNARYDLRQAIWKCHCGGLLDITGDIEFSRDDIDSQRSGLWRYRKAIPVDPDAIVSFGEGMTPLLTLPIGGREVFVKQEHLFQSGSYKDRGATVLISHARSIGIREVVEDSSGNAGCAIAAYCAKADIACEIYVPESTSPAKLVQIEGYGAVLRKIPGTREDTARAVLDAAQDTYYASHSWNPFFFQGTKTFAYEVFEQLGWRTPDVVILPVGNGTLLLGAYLGFMELSQVGMIDRMPRLIGVQASACSPLARLAGGEESASPDIASSSTLAEGIAIAQPVRGKQIIEAVRHTVGQFVTVTESEIVDALNQTLRMGFFIEPTSAAAIAGVRKLIHSIPPDAIIVSAFTGHGLKAVEKIAKLAHPTS